jgi:hypothetical protein
LLFYCGNTSRMIAHCCGPSRQQHILRIRREY